jgi:hypothetical protein
MRRFDKNENIRKANMLAEQRYLKSKGLISENDSEDWELEDRKKQYGINPEIEPTDLQYNELREDGNEEMFIP